MSDAVADVLQEHPVFVAWKAVVPHRVHLSILGIFQSLPTACGSSTGLSPGWFHRLMLFLSPQACPRALSRLLDHWTGSEVKHTTDLIKP